MSESCELIEQVENRGLRFCRIAGHVDEALSDDEAQPARIAREPIGRQDQEYRCGALLQIGEGKIALVENARHARTIEEMGMALGGRQHAGGFPAGLAEMAVGGAGDQAAGGVGFLHALKQVGEAVRRQGEILAQRSKVTPAVGFDGDDFQDEAGNERLGFLVPMGLAGHARFVEDEGVGKGAGIFGDIEAGHIEPVERIEGGRGQAGDAEGIETWTGPKDFLARPAILAFSPLGSMQITERSAVSRFGMMAPTPLPVRVGAMVMRCAGPS